MDLFVLVGQRKERYEGEYGLEALACMTEYDQDANPEYLVEEKQKYESSQEFEALSVARLQVDEAAIRAILFPADKPIPAKIARSTRKGN